jgi:hypothetical protein
MRPMFSWGIVLSVIILSTEWPPACCRPSGFGTSATCRGEALLFDQTRLDGQHNEATGLQRRDATGDPLSPEQWEGCRTHQLRLAQRQVVAGKDFA